MNKNVVNYLMINLTLGTLPVGKIRKQNLLQKFSKKYKNLTEPQTGIHPVCGFFILHNEKVQDKEIAFII